LLAEHDQRHWREAKQAEHDLIAQLDLGAVPMCLRFGLVPSPARERSLGSNTRPERDCGDKCSDKHQHSRGESTVKTRLDEQEAAAPRERQQHEHHDGV